MSQPPRKQKTKQGSSYNQPSGGKARQQAGRQGAQSTRGSQPPVTRRPVQQGSQSSLSREVDRRLPQRYVVIWLLGMIPLVVVLLLLLRPGGDQSGQGTQQTAQATATTSTGAFATDGTPAGQTGAIATPTLSALNVPQVATSGPGKYMVIDTAKGKIVAKLYTEEEAGVAKTIANFEEKAKAGYFNGLTFHRVEDWVIQGGDPVGNGTGGGDMPSEYNMVPFGAGALGVARGGDPAINNDSQFFITKSASGWLDGQYTNWGQVTEGMDVVNAIAIGDKINSVTVEDRQ
jgi:peptidyl-prolyl cis-trans isomerase B (cyclophilin B)